MIVVDQHNAMGSLYRSLVPSDRLIDGRTSIDSLSFIAEFASLINFYDHTGSVNGNWKPFILKDPVFLLARIAKTPVAAVNKEFSQSISSLKSSLSSVSGSAVRSSLNGGTYMNGIFNQLFRIFSSIGDWTYYMQRSYNYDLKKYVLSEVKYQWAPVFWALADLRENLHIFSPEVFNSFSPGEFIFAGDPTWEQLKNKRPYWEILGVDQLTRQSAHSALRLNTYFDAVADTGERLMDFFAAVVHEAKFEFEKVAAYKSQYPDTTLLRVLEKLSEIHRSELNELAAKHLQFYYRDILHQQPLAASPDSAFIYATLAKNNATFRLRAGTLLDGGTDAAGNSVSFVLEKDATLNPATIASAYTITKTPTPAARFSSLNIKTITTPGAVQKDQAGIIQAWDTFGTGDASGILHTALLIASPLLLLGEGKRTITLDLELNTDTTLGLLQSAKYYLSTSSGWLQVSPGTIEISYTEDPGTELIDPRKITVRATLPPTAPAVVPYPANAEGFSTAWPMIKIGFRYFDNLASPPLLQAFEISVSAAGLTDLQLYSDYGALTSKAPFPPLGPTPLLNSSFIFGSTEIFSKPVTSLYLELNWDNLPLDFQNYYQAYNDYLQMRSRAISAAEELAKEKQKRKNLGFWATVWNGVLTAFHPVIAIFKALGRGTMRFLRWLFNPYCPSPDPSDVPYNNVCFTVDFSLLQAKTWTAVPMQKMDMQQNIDGSMTFTPYAADEDCIPCATPEVNKNLLFSTQSTDTSKCVLTNASYFGCTSPSSAKEDTGQPSINFFNPDIQNEPLRYTSASEYGFMRMRLTGPGEGFGSSIYSNVVTNIAIDNASLISIYTPQDDLLRPANLPFVPRLTSFKAHYSAQQRYDFGNPGAPYPPCCYLYAPFSSPLLKDTATGIACSNDAPPRTDVSGIQLYPSFAFDAALFVQMQHAVLPGDIHLYFQLASSFGATSATQDQKTLKYCYATDNGWQTLRLLADGTRGLSCTGIISLSLDAERTAVTDKNCCLSIGISGSPAAYAQTVLLQTNGLQVTRCGNAYLNSDVAPALPAGTITKAVSPIPEVASFVQPFDSFDGKAAETAVLMNQRVSNRIKTKDRAVSAEDFVRLIQQQFNNVFYTKAAYDTDKSLLRIGVVKAVKDYTEPNALLPLITVCEEAAIRTYLEKRAGVFSPLLVSNFSIEYVRVNAVIELASGYELDGVSRDINHALNIFLSPWIATSVRQIQIDQGISTAAVSSFISGISGVASVANVSLKTTGSSLPASVQTIGVAYPREKPFGLLVPEATHHIQLPPGQ